MLSTQRRSLLFSGRNVRLVMSFSQEETLKYSPLVHHDHESQPSQTRPGGLGILGAWGSPGRWALLLCQPDLLAITKSARGKLGFESKGLRRPPCRCHPGQAGRSQVSCCADVQDRPCREALPPPPYLARVHCWGAGQFHTSHFTPPAPPRVRSPACCPVPSSRDRKSVV